MAHKGPKVLLGFEDESISDKHKSLVNFTTNKIGGCPDWPVEGIETPVCQLCGLILPLVVQVYAPLENSSFHRTLYLFGCINPNCWNQNESWVCRRSQIMEANGEREVVSSKTENTLSVADWCGDADDWGDDNNANNNEENGNVIGCAENCYGCFSDDDDETEDYEDIRVNLGNISVDECNANLEAHRVKTSGDGVQEGGAVGRLHSPSATAEIEGEESELVSIDTPTAPQRDVIALLQEVAPVPTEFCTASSGGHSKRFTSPPQFAPMFISVGEEETLSGNSPTTEHVRELLQEYQQNTEDRLNMLSPQHEKSTSQGQSEQLTVEKYEKSIPAHGDRMFHHFVTRIQENPGQILRYCREATAPLLLYPLHEYPTRCQQCCSEMVFEMQIIPTIIPKLHLLRSGAVSEGAHLEFGSILIFTCRRSCWAAGDLWREEPVVVQVERI